MCPGVEKQMLYFAPLPNDSESALTIYSPGKIVDDWWARFVDAINIP